MVEILTPASKWLRIGWISYSFPIVSIEDGLAEDDWDGWSLLTKAWQKCAISWR